jgi:diaminohydroxyphosphoribosylaminopyrimidine deaminase/5-amino-6-(5-phosphoribosylamino)uracil reductase
MRSEEHAILIGTNTAINDNPGLTVRDWSGLNPLRIVIDRDLKIPDSYKIFKEKGSTLVFTNSKASSKLTNVDYVNSDFSKSIISQMMDHLWLHQIQSLIIEGGSNTLQQFIDMDVWDEIYEFQGAVSFGKGLKAPVFHGEAYNEIKFDDTILKNYKNISK